MLSRRRFVHGVSAFIAAIVLAAARPPSKPPPPGKGKRKAASVSAGVASGLGEALMVKRGPSAGVSPQPAIAAAGTGAALAATTDSSALVVESFPLSGTAAQLSTAIEDMDIDVIEMAAGTYHFTDRIFINTDRTARPLTIRPAAGATVTLAGDQIDTGMFYFGLGGVAKYVTIENLILDDYDLAQTGVVWMGNASHITMNDITVSNVTTREPGGPIFSVALYLSNNNGVCPNDIIADRWTVLGAGQNIGAYQSQPSSTQAHIWARDWNVDEVAYSVFAGGGPTTDFILDGWTITDSWRPDITPEWWTIRFDSSLSGTMSNMTATGSGGIQQTWGGMTDGGGNTGLPVRS